MSRHTVDEKYKKYLGLLQKEPLNTLYKRKLQKYKAMSSKSVQRGGKGSDQSSGHNSTSDLINKITNMLAQQNRPSTGTKDSRKHKTYIKGGAEGEEKKEAYRLIDFGADDFNADNIISQNKLGLNDYNAKLDQVGIITAQNSAIADKIIEGVDRLKREKEQIGAELANITAKVTELENTVTRCGIEKGEMGAQLMEETTRYDDLSNALVAIVGELKMDPQKRKEMSKELIQRVKLLTEQSGKQLKIHNEEKAIIEEQLVQATRKENECKTQHEAISKLLETTKTRANDLLTRVTQKYNGNVDRFGHEIEEYIKQLNDLQTKLKAIDDKLPKVQAQ